MEELVSIIVLTYNNSKYYKECLTSICNQSYSNIQLIISDDGSDVFESEEIRQWLTIHNKGNISNYMIYQNKTNQGVVKHYNSALRRCEGEYIVYLAIDDRFYDDDVIKDIVQYFKEHPHQMIATGYRDVYTSDLVHYVRTLPRDNEVKMICGLSPYELYEKLCMGSFIAGCNTPFRRELLEKHGYLDESYYYLEDYPRYLNLLRNHYEIGFIPRKLIKYRLGGITTQGAISEVLRKDLYTAAEKEKREYIINKYSKYYPKDKRIIGWGTGDCYNECREKYNIQVEYLIDSNPKQHGNTVEKVKIYGPEQLLFEKDNKDVFILVFSYANYFDIAQSLENMGFKEEKDYGVCTPEILKVLIEINR